MVRAERGLSADSNEALGMEILKNSEQLNKHYFAPVAQSSGLLNSVPAPQSVNK